MIDTLVSMLGGQANTVAFAVLGGVIGFLAKGFYDLWSARRKDKLERVNQQLKCLYGPLFSLVHISTITWQGFVEKYCQNPGSGFLTGRGVMPQTPEAECIWRHWMQEVFMPLNVQMAELIIINADLLEDRDMPNCLLKLSAHVHGYKGIIAAWRKEDYSRHMSLTPFPINELLPYAEETYHRLKSRQARLIGH